MLSVIDLTVRYGHATAVDRLSFKVGEGEVVALVGANGAGKTTTLSAVSGIARPSSGAIEFSGRSLVGLRPEQIVLLGVVHVPEGRRIFQTLSVAENLRLGLRGADSESDSAIADVLDRFPALKRYYKSSAAKLSGGEQQQLAIARGLLCRPRLLMLDEPSLGLAPRLIDEMFEALTRLRNEGVTILLVEQLAQRAVGFADRSYVLRLGRIVQEGTPTTFASREVLANAYMGT